ncbi:MAG: hypothetical protein ACOZF0_17315 [Thermodesulfobacteriota bacterium]
MKQYKKNVNVIIEATNGVRYRGKLNLKAEIEPIDRLSDLFVKGKNPFVTLYGVTAQGSNKVVILNKSHIVAVMPDGEDVIEDESEIVVQK